MMVTGMSLAEFESKVIRPLNETKFAENNIVISNPRVYSNNRFAVKIDMSDSRKPGSRRTWQGRHGKYASWWTFRDIMDGVFHHNEGARISTGNTVYRGRSDFNDQTMYGPQNNIGSMMYPCYHEDVSIDLDFDTDEFNWATFSRGEGWSSYVN